MTRASSNAALKRWQNPSYKEKILRAMNAPKGKRTCPHCQKECDPRGYAVHEALCSKRTERIRLKGLEHIKPDV